MVTFQFHILKKKKTDSIAYSKILRYLSKGVSPLIKKKKKKKKKNIFSIVLELF